MSEEVITSIAEDVKAPVEKKPITEKDYLSQRIAKMKGPTERKPETAEAPAEAPTLDVKPEATAEAPASPDVLSKSLEEMTEAELDDLGKRLGSKAVARFGELTFKRKQAEEQVEQLRAELARREQAVADAPKVENNPYAHLDTVEKLKAEEQTIADLIEFADEAMFKASDLGAYEVAATLDGKDYTKAELRQILVNARKARDKFIPAQRNELSARQQREAFEKSLKQKARQELSWMDGEDNDTRKRFEAITVDPRFKKLREAVPDLAPQLEYLMAHAANSMYGRKTIETPPPATTLKPPSSPTVSAAVPERAAERQDKVTKDQMERFRKTGRADDFIALRTAQISKRKPA